MSGIYPQDHRADTPGEAEPVRATEPGSAAEEASRSGQNVPASSDQAATADRVGPAVASPDGSANLPGPAETSTAGATGVGPIPAPVVDTQEQERIEEEVAGGFRCPACLRPLPT
jgi:hypothetical protein